MKDNSADTFHNAVTELRNAFDDAFTKPLLGVLTIIVNRINKWIRKK